LRPMRLTRPKPLQVKFGHFSTFAAMAFSIRTLSVFENVHNLASAIFCTSAESSGVSRTVKERLPPGATGETFEMPFERGGLGFFI
jgi:hypothetical protein